MAEDSKITNVDDIAESIGLSVGARFDSAFGGFEKQQLEIARYASVGVKVVAILLVPFFNSFDSIYEAHGWFHSTFTPPLVVAVFFVSKPSSGIE